MVIALLVALVVTWIMAGLFARFMFQRLTEQREKIRAALREARNAEQQVWDARTHSLELFDLLTEVQGIARAHEMTVTMLMEEIIRADNTTS